MSHNKTIKHPSQTQLQTNTNYQCPQHVASFITVSAPELNFILQWPQRLFIDAVVLYLCDLQGERIKSVQT